MQEVWQETQELGGVCATGGRGEKHRVICEVCEVGKSCYKRAQLEDGGRLDLGSKEVEIAGQMEEEETSFLNCTFLQFTRP